MDNGNQKRKTLEKLDDCIQVFNPGVWILLAGIIMIFAGVVIWGIFGRINNSVSTIVKVEDDEIVCYVGSDDIDAIEIGMVVEFENVQATIVEAGTINELGYAFNATTESDVPDGVYDGRITIGYIKPIEFVVN